MVRVRRQVKEGMSRYKEGAEDLEIIPAVGKDKKGDWILDPEILSMYDSSILLQERERRYNS